MTDKEYQDKKRECWENIKFALRAPNTDRKTFDFIFDRVYALGKQTEAIMREDVEKAAEEYAEKAMEHVYSGEWDSEYVQCLIEAAWYDGYTALGKQEKESKSMQLSDVKQKIDAWMESHTEEEVYELLKKHGAVEEADTVISGWTARDKDGALQLWESKPQRNNITNDEWGMTNGIMLLPSKLFPDLTWVDEPIEVELIIKRKKK